VETCDRSMQMRKTYLRHHTPVFLWSEEIAAQRGTCLRDRRLDKRGRGTTRLDACDAIRASKRECFLILSNAAESRGGAHRMVVKRVHSAIQAPSDPIALDNSLRSWRRWWESQNQKGKTQGNQGEGVSLCRET